MRQPRPAKTAALVLITAVLSLTMFAGSVISISLRKGLGSLRSRLGADLMVIPSETEKDARYKNIILQSSIGEFYMESDTADRIACRDDVGQASEQFFLASANSGCCSVPVQIIGFDPDTDFTVMPWIKSSYGKELEDMDIVIGSGLNALVGDKLTFYGMECRVAAKLANTGTGFDTAVFTNENTIKKLMRSAKDKDMDTFDNIDPDKTVSCLLINIAEGCSPQQVRLDINKTFKNVKAIQTEELISGVSESLNAASDIAKVLAAVGWILGLGILFAAYNININSRKKEFAVLRCIGFSRKQLAAVVMKEALMIGTAGAVIGVLAGVLAVVPFNAMIENKLEMPFLLPGIDNMIGLVVLSLVSTAAVGALSAAVSAFALSRVDAALVLRGDN
ncbi:MAG: ABC transporter permease [Firmicutes bacterium]|nr:ABC transporter permease [Bacillota bacterium]